MSRRLGAALAGSLLAATLAGCGPDPAEPGPTGSPEPTESTPSTSDPTEDPTGSQSASVTPASGVLLKGVGVRVRAPKGWERQDQLVEFVDSAQDPASQSAVTVSSVKALSDATLQELAEAGIELGGYVRDPEILEPVVVNGVECYHVAGRIDPNSTIEDIGTIHAGQIVAITLHFDLHATTAQERREITESVWASIEWV